MLIEHDYGSTVVARDSVFCLKFLRTAMQAQMQEDPKLVEHFHNRVTERLLRTTEELRRIDQALAVRGPVISQPKPERFVPATYGRF